MAVKVWPDLQNCVRNQSLDVVVSQILVGTHSYKSQGIMIVIDPEKARSKDPGATCSIYCEMHLVPHSTHVLPEMLTVRRNYT